MLVADDSDMTARGLRTVMLAGLLAHDHPVQPALPHRDPTAMARRLRGGRRRWSKPRHGDRRGSPRVHDQRREPSLHALRLIDVVTAAHSHLNELATLEFGLQHLARLEAELVPD